MKTYSVIIAGDLLPWYNNEDLFKKGDAESLFGKTIQKLFSESDFSIINLEGPLTNSTVRQKKIGPVIKADPNTINGIRHLGVKCVALANNHITDYLRQGYMDTIESLNSNHIGYVGAGLNINDIRTHLSVSLGEKRLCIYNVSETFFNEPTNTSAGVNLYDEYRVCNEIRELKSRHDYLIVVYHGGAEYFPYPTPQTRQRFHRMADCGADFITAQHTHCIGCEENYNGAYLLYGQGNFLFAKQMTKPMTKEGFVLELIIGEEVEIVKHHVELTEEACLKVTSFTQQREYDERCMRINDEDYIIRQFEMLKPDNIIDKYLLAFKGKYPLSDGLKRIMPQKLWRKFLESYTRNQIMRNKFVLNSDRASEDVYYMWNHIAKKNEKH